MLRLALRSRVVSLSLAVIAASGCSSTSGSGTSGTGYDAGSGSSGKKDAGHSSGTASSSTSASSAAGSASSRVPPLIASAALSWPGIGETSYRPRSRA